MMSGKVTAIILAAGRGSRMKSDVKKQFMELANKPVLYYSVKAFEESDVDEIILVTMKEDFAYCEQEIVNRYGFKKVSNVVAGGKERYDSVKNGVLAAAGDICLIHDGARPLIETSVINKMIALCEKEDAVILGVDVKDTIKIINEKGYIEQTPSREMLRAAQTPQMFSKQLLLASYKEMERNPIPGLNVTDDAMIVQYYGGKKSLVMPGDYRNIKVTTQEDLKFAELFIKT